MGACPAGANRDRRCRRAICEAPRRPDLDSGKELSRALVDSDRSRGSGSRAGAYTGSPNGRRPVALDPPRRLWEGVRFPARGARSHPGASLVSSGRIRGGHRTGSTLRHRSGRPGGGLSVRESARSHRARGAPWRDAGRREPRLVSRELRGPARRIPGVHGRGLPKRKRDPGRGYVLETASGGSVESRRLCLFLESPSSRSVPRRLGPPPQKMAMGEGAWRTFSTTHRRRSRSGLQRFRRTGDEDRAIRRSAVASLSKETTRLSRIRRRMVGTWIGFSSATSIDPCGCPPRQRCVRGSRMK